MMLQVRELNAYYAKKQILDRVSFELDAGEWLMLCGPNGAGKSTLAKALSGQISIEGKVYLEGRELQSYRPAELARRIGFLAQQHTVSYAFTVDEIVAMGRYSHKKGMLHGTDPEGTEMVEWALDITGLTSLRSRNIMQLSGGEIQRVFLAQVFAQSPSILLLDEPSNHLDMKYQKQIFELIDEWLREGNRAVISVVHDLSLARKYGSKALLLDRGHVAACGSMTQVLSDENLNGVYDMDVREWMTTLYEGWK